MGKVDNNKQQKRNSLLDSAFSLFIHNGFNKTSISDIVNAAGVAKGTFYLYFKDKYDIRNHLISHKASQVFLTAYNELQKHEEICDFEDQVLFIVDNILDQFAENHSLVMLISKHLSWGFFTNSLIETPDKDVPAIYHLSGALGKIHSHIPGPGTDDVHDTGTGQRSQLQHNFVSAAPSSGQNKRTSLQGS